MRSADEVKNVLLGKIGQLSNGNSNRRIGGWSRLVHRRMEWVSFHVYDSIVPMSLSTFDTIHMDVITCNW